MRIPALGAGVLATFVVCGCTSSPNTAPNAGAPSPGPLVAIPSSLYINTAFGPPGTAMQQIVFTRTPGTISNLTIAVSQPLVIEASQPTYNGNSATVTLTGFSGTSAAPGGATATPVLVTASDSAGSTIVPVTAQLCGRPDGINNAALVFPPRGIPLAVNAGTLYFAVYTGVAQPSGSVVPWILRLLSSQRPIDVLGLTVVGAPPPGASPPQAPLGPPYANLTYVSASIPALAAATTYTAQIVDDACQPATVAVSFSTSS